MSSTSSPTPDATSATPATTTPSTPIDRERALELQQALLKGLGVPDLTLPEGLSPQLMEDLGRMLREMTEGTVDMLRLRSQAKSSIHAEMTIIGPRAVNPLKAAWDVDVALRHLLAPQRADLMGPVRAVTDAYDDLRAHDRGLAAGIEAALQSLLRRFSPEEFDQRLAGGALDRFLPANRKARQWDLLLELYEDIAKEAQEDFWSVFEREFRRAYSTGQGASPSKT
jgi:type VI secretion system FHA domain protein